MVFLAVTDPCETLNIWIGNSDHPDDTVPELAVGKWPNTRPTMDNLEWTSYNWDHQNLTISAWYLNSSIVAAMQYSSLL